MSRPEQPLKLSVIAHPVTSLMFLLLLQESMEIKQSSKATYSEDVISTSGQLFTRMREPCNGAAL